MIIRIIITIKILETAQVDKYQVNDLYFWQRWYKLNTERHLQENLWAGYKRNLLVKKYVIIVIPNKILFTLIQHLTICWMILEINFERMFTPGPEKKCSKTVLYLIGTHVNDSPDLNAGCLLITFCCRQKNNKKKNNKDWLK